MFSSSTLSTFTMQHAVVCRNKMQCTVPGAVLCQHS